MDVIAIAAFAIRFSIDQDPPPKKPGDNTSKPAG